MEPDVQIIMLGESEVGKTSLLRRFIHGTFRDQLPRTRIDHDTKTVNIKGKDVNVTFWDTAGQEIYYSVTRGYYRVADGVLLVYDVRNAETFLKLSKWLTDLKSVNETAQVIIAGNKCEDPERKTVNVTVVENFAQEEDLEHLEVSAMSGENVEKIFLYLLEKILIARGILPLPGNYPRFEEERMSEEENVSPVPSNHSDSLEIPNTDNMLPDVVPERVVSLPEKNQDPDNLPACETVLSASTKPSSNVDYPEEEEFCKGGSERPYYRAEGCQSDDESACSSECEFFDALGDDELLSESEVQEGVVR